MDAQILDEAAVARAWDRNAPTWIEQVRAGYDRYRELFTFPAFLSFLPDLSGKEVVDLGCGEGSNTRALARRGLRMTGVDLSAGMIDAAQAVESTAPLGIVYRRGSFTRLDDLPDAAFDAAVSTMALMDSPDFAAAARAAQRVLRPGGGLYFSVLHPCFITPGTLWQRDDTGRETGLVVADYFSGESAVDRWCFSKAPETAGSDPFQVPRFGYRLEDYVNGLGDAGFRIDRIEEPRPTEAMAKEHPWLDRWHKHAALILLIGAKKE